VDGGPLLREVAGEPVLFMRVGGADYAYRPVCPACSGDLEHATLAAAHLTCSECGSSYDVRLAGRALDGEGHLAPVPLLADGDGRISVALGAPA
jgi:nitrite reductase/ring-hydroxylating ferredoxin subunit